jgi:hypothetical protein
MKPLDRLISAIVENNIDEVETMLAAAPDLALASVDQERLFESGITHWIYVDDTPLHVASAGYRSQMIRALLACDADPNAAMNRRRSTPLHYAADGFITGTEWDPAQQVGALETLLKGGAHLDAQDKNGATALHRAVRTRCADAVEFLLSAGSDAELRNESGSTAFHLAVQTTGRGGSGASIAKDAQRRIILSMLAHGVRSDVEDGSGRSVVECARSDWIRDLLQPRR